MVKNLKVVSLLPSATEILAALKLTDFLVGRSHECDYPPEVQNLPICTEARLDPYQPSAQIDAKVQALLESALSIYKIKTDVLEQLQPTHIITQDLCDVCAVSFEDVEKAIAQLTNSKPQIISLRPNLLTHVWADIQRVAQMLEVDPEPLLSNLQSRIKACQQKTQNLSQENIPTVFAIEWIEPLMGVGNWIPELIVKAGGNPLFGNAGEDSSYFQWEKIVEADPEVIIIMPCGFDLERTRQESQILTQHQGWSDLKAVKNGRVFITDGNAYFNRPGPRLVDSLEILAEILHPELFDFGDRQLKWDNLE